MHIRKFLKCLKWGFGIWNNYPTIYPMENINWWKYLCVILIYLIVKLTPLFDNENFRFMLIKSVSKNVDRIHYPWKSKTRAARWSEVVEKANFFSFLVLKIYRIVLEHASFHCTKFVGCPFVRKEFRLSFNVTQTITRLLKMVQKYNTVMLLLIQNTDFNTPKRHSYNWTGFDVYHKHLSLI